MKKLYILTVVALVSLSSFAQTAPFITTWSTANPGGTDNKTITIPASGSYNIAWFEIGGTGYTGTSSGSNTITLTFPEPGNYKVEMTPATGPGTPFSAISFGGPDANGIADSLKLTGVTQWGDISWSNMIRAFYHCSNLVITATDIPDLSNVETTSQMFYYCTAIATIPNIASWDVSNVTTMSYMFSNASNFNDNINSWDVGQVVSMYDMFDGATSFNQPLNNWDVSNVTNMSYMFLNAVNFNQPLNNWDVQNVINLIGTFYGATAFNQNINNWNVGNVTDMNGTFSNASSFNQPLNSWDVSSVTNMASMFYNASSFNQPLNNWNVSNVQRMDAMFYNAIPFNQDISSWNVSNVTDMTNMFRSTAFNRPLNNWNVSKVTSMGSMFNSAAAFNQPLNSWDVSHVTSMTRMFRNASTFNQSLENWNLGSITSLTEMLDFSGLDCQNYDNTLIGWAANTSTPNGLTLGAEQLGYDTPAQTAHSTLTTTKGWTINDAGLTQGCAIALPIKLTPGSFKAAIQNSHIYLSWSSSTELNNAGFIIERSEDAIHWTTLGFVASKSDNASSTINLSYSFTDLSPVSGKNYYRLIQTDNNGSPNVSGVISINFTNGKNSLVVYPNPAHETITVNGLKTGDKGFIYTSAGQLTDNFEATSASMRINIDRLSPGVYYIKIQSQNKSRSTVKFIVK